jgi:protein associated with RNAse G/E
VHSADNTLIESITVFDKKKSFADNGITRNDTTKYYVTLSPDVEIDYNSIPSYPEGNNPLIIYKKDV